MFIGLMDRKNVRLWGFCGPEWKNMSFPRVLHLCWISLNYNSLKSYFKFKFSFNFLWVVANSIQIHIQWRVSSSVFFFNFAQSCWHWWIDCKNNCETGVTNTPWNLTYYFCNLIHAQPLWKKKSVEVTWWEWVNDDKMLIFGWTGPLTLTFKHITVYIVDSCLEYKSVFQKYMPALCISKYRAVPE